MRDRAQFTTPRAVRLLVTGAIALLVLALVIEEALSAPALAGGEVEQVCGLCHVDWRPAVALLVIGALVKFAAHTVSFVKWPPKEEERDE